MMLDEAKLVHINWLFEKRKPRNAQSLLTEKWLSSHGLDWTGK